MTKHIMIDLETWGKKPGDDLRSIGACVFDPLTGSIGGYRIDGKDAPGHPDDALSFYIATDNPKPPKHVLGVEQAPVNIDEYHWDEDASWRKYPLTRDPETVAWWDNPDRAIAAGEPFTNPVDLRYALEAFTQWLCKVTGKLPFDTNGKWRGIDCALWSHGPAFDAPILAAAYDAVGLPVPWHYRAPRDTRTAFDMADVGDHSAFMQQYNHGTAHHALDDAISQAKAVCGAYARLRISHDVVTHRDAWRKAIQTAASHTSSAGSYFDHELKTFDQTFDALAHHPQLEGRYLTSPADYDPTRSYGFTISDVTDQLK